MIYNAFLFSDIGKIIQQAIRTFFGTIAATIYSIISYLYDVFILIAKAEILNSDIVQKIYRSVGLILGMFMIFKLTFSLIQALIDPDKLTDKKNGFTSIIMRCIISIVLLGITPSLFKEAFKLQNLLVGANNSNDNIIYKLIMQNSIGVNSSNMGRKLAADLYFSFYTDEEFPKYDLGTAEYDERLEERYQSINYTTLKENVTNGAVKADGNSKWSFYDTIGPLSIRRDSQFVIEFNELFINIVGCAVAYILFVYCFQVAARVFKLAFLQLVAPVPILSYISDPDGSFKNWVKQCTTTYLDLFLRLIIIYFVMYLSNDVLDQLNDTNSVLMDSINGSQLSFPTIALIKIFLILGLLIFAKKVPELIGDIFPGLSGGKGSLGFGLGLKKNVLDPIKDTGKHTPLGWGIKGGKALGTYIDRKAHNLPKPRGKFGQAMDKWLPGRGEAIKQRRQAEEDERQYNKSLVDGEKIYNKAGGKLAVTEIDEKTKEERITGIKAGIFKHQEYANSLLEVERAKAENKKAEQEYQTEYARYQAAYNSGDEAAIKRAEDRIKTAETNKKVAAGKLELAQNKHNANKKIYTDDAHREEVFDYYKKTHGKAKEYENEPKTQNNQSTSTTPQNNQQPQSTNNQHQSSSNTPPSVFGNVENYGEDGNPYEAGYGQFTADNTPSGNNNSTYGNDDGNPYETGHGQFNTTGANNSNEDDNPYTNPNYYNNSGQNSSSNNNDEFDGSNYY